MVSFTSAVVARVMRKIRSRKALLLDDLFTSPDEMNLYRQLATAPESRAGHPAVTLHPRCLGGNAVVCRPGTRDRSSLEDLLVHRFYLPPAELREPRVIVDLGANVGYTMAHFAYLYPRARIVGVELDRDNFAVALQNTEWCREKVTLINAAIWSSDGYIEFRGDGEDAYHVVSSVGDRTGKPMPLTSQMARSVTMQSLLADRNIAHVDYMKMDIEGGEKEIVLNGERSWLDKVDVMKIELHRAAYNDFDDVLTSHGFRCRKEYMGVPCIVATRG